MKFFLHPLMVPFYAFCILMGLEMQSYALEFRIMVVFALTILFVTAIYPYFSRFEFLNRDSAVSYDAMLDVDAPLSARIRYAVYLLIFYVTFTLLINKFSIEIFNIWGYRYLFYPLFLPLVANIFSGKGFCQIFKSHTEFFLSKVNIAPSSYFGALAGMVLIFGYRSAIDTFWPFVAAILLFTLQSMMLVNRMFQRFSSLCMSFLFGFIQSLIILSLLK